MVAVEAVVEPWHEGSEDEEGDAGVVQFGEDATHLGRVAVEGVVEPREGHTRHCRQEESHEHQYFLPRIWHIAGSDEEPEGDSDQNERPDQVGPDVDSLRVQTEH